jgi:signal transduction histidine kinase
MALPQPRSSAADRAAADRSRVDQLLDAVTAVGSGLELQVVLHRIVEAAVELVDARYGALGVVDGDGRGLSQFITVGVDDTTVQALGAPPTGHGVLGEILRDPRALRLPDLTAHPASVGFPAGHPPMRSFLGVPVRVGDAVFGNLYLTEKRGDREFTDDDQAVVQALAVAAGIAVQNARLYDMSRRRGAWMEAGREISTSLLSGTEREDVIALVVERACDLLEAGVAFVAVRRPGGLYLEASSGPESMVDVPQLAEPLGRVLTGGIPQDVAVDGLTGTAVPLGPPGRPGQGVLVVLWRRRPDAGVMRPLAGFAAQAAVALELAERRHEAERFAIVQDRDRIGRDLHDLVIQRLFAAGMQLQSAVRLVEQDPAEAAARVNRAVDELDGTIRELRSTIYGLQAPLEGRPSLRAQVLQVADAGTVQLGFPPALRLDGLLDTLVGTEVAGHAVATLREALSNAARHAGARRVDVLVAVRDGTLLVEVEDDGVGLPDGAPRSGLSNIADRAEQLGGHLRLTPGKNGGTRLSWQVPI